jgi:hypothetical protein
MLRLFSRSLSLVAIISGVACVRGASDKPSTLLIAVERLGYTSFSCNAESIAVRSSTGFKEICDTSVRFSHAYTPSTQSQATLASFLTGRYPHQHMLRSNGSEGLAMSFVTIPELLRKSGVKTGFFSGGPPIFRKSGLNQGFDIFDDTYSISDRDLYQNSRQTNQTFLNWLDGEVRGAPFFATLFWSDLQFTDVPTRNELGEIRESSADAQMTEIEVSLSLLIQELKKRNRWDKTNIIFVGLNGETDKFLKPEFPPLNLFAESTHVKLFVKPTRAPQEAAVNWQVDSNVSTADLGPTIAKIHGLEFEESNDVFRTVPLNEVFEEDVAPDWRDDRRIISESGWGLWREVSPVRVSVRTGSMFYIFDETPKFYNTLNDNLENAQINTLNLKTAELVKKLRVSLESVGYQPWKLLRPDSLIRYEVGRKAWNLKSRATDAGRSAEPGSDIILQTMDWLRASETWLTSWYILKQGLISESRADIKQVDFRGQHPALRSVFRRWSNKPPLTAKKSLPCSTLFDLRTKPDVEIDKTCLSPMISAIREFYLSLQSSDRRSTGLDDFRRRIDEARIELRLAQSSYAGGSFWDISSQIVDYIDPGLLLLDLPEYRKDLKLRGLKPIFEPLISR